MEPENATSRQGVPVLKAKKDSRSSKQFDISFAAIDEVFCAKQKRSRSAKFRRL